MYTELLNSKDDATEGNQEVAVSDIALSNELEHREQEMVPANDNSSHAESWHKLHMGSKKLR